jgi:enoyl-CoA hydratase/carnithine racemase
MPATVRVTVDDKVGTLALDNVAKRKPLGAGTVAELVQALNEFERAGLLAVGILNQPVAADALEDRAYELARTLRSRSGEAIRASKLQATTFVRAVALSAQDSQWINQLRHDVYSGDDYAEGIPALHEKRAPDFA